MSELYSIIDETTVMLPKSICNFMKENKEITTEILLLLEMLINEKSTIKINNELINEIRTQNRTLTSYIKDMSQNYKEGMDHLQIVQKQGFDHLQTVQKQTSDIITKLGPDIINNVYMKMYELNKENEKTIELITSKNTNQNANNIVDKIEKETENIIIKTQNIINEIIPKQELELNKNYNILINEFNKEVMTKLELYKTNSITLETLNIILNEKNKLLTQDIQSNIISYLNNVDMNIKNNTLKTEKHQDTMESELRKFLDQYKVSSKKGEFSEQIVQGVLCSMFPKDEIINVTREGEKKCDFELIRENKPTILIENKDYEIINVPKNEVQKFITNIIDNNVCGIMISQRSGISHKSDFEIEFHNNIVLIYLHKVNYDSTKIQIAIDIIDNLYPKLTELYINDKFVITNEQINKINDEYIEFIKQRNEIINDMNFMLTTTIDKIKKLEITSINNILCNSFSNTKLTNKQSFNCKICNKIFTSNRSLSNHTRTCKNKAEVIQTETKLDNKQNSETNKQNSQTKLDNKQNSQTKLDNKQNSETKLDNKQNSETKLDNKQNSETKLDNKQNSETSSTNSKHEKPKKKDKNKNQKRSETN
jgi:hypothetical protein